MTTVTPPRAAGPAVEAGPLGRRARLDAAVRLGAATVLWAALLLVTYWWVADGGVQALGAWASGFTSVGRLTGLVASVLLLAQVTLMTRLPILEPAFGQDRLARLHRLVGFWSFDLMVLHVVAITWGYAGGGLGSTPGTLWHLTVDYPGMLLAAAGTVCLFLVVGTSVRAARRRLRYESWHLLHLYAYLGVGLALPHQLWTGQQLTSSPGRSLFWWTAWGAVAGAVLVWRVGLPIARNVRHQLRVTSVVPEADGTVSVYLTGRRLDRLPVEAGQFLSWRFPGRPGWTRGHPYSLSAAPDGRSLRITVQAVGDGSADAHYLLPGTRAVIEGPHGRLTARARRRRKVLLVGAGVGVTPLRALAEGLAYAPGDVLLLHRYTHRPLFAAEFEALARERGLRIVGLPGHRRSADSWLGPDVGEVSDLEALLWWVPDVAERDVYACGPAPWTDLLRADLLQAGLTPDQIHLETFAW